MIVNDGAFCQEEEEDEGQDEDFYDSEGEAEQDRLALIQEAGMLIAALAKAFQQRWIFYFPLCERMMRWIVCAF